MNNKRKTPPGISAGHKAYKPYFRKKTLATLICISMSTHGVPVMARDTFDAGMIQAGLQTGQSVDLSQFESRGEQLSGDYVADIYINNTFFATRSLYFVRSQKGELQAQLTPALLDDMGVNTEAVSALKEMKPGQTLTDLPAILPEAQSRFDFDRQRLDISVPQASMKPDAGEMANRSLWDNGIPALILNYNLTGSNSRMKTEGSGEQKNNSLFGSLSPGINLGAWRLRSQMSWSLSQTHGGGAGSSYSDFSVWDTALTRDVPSLNGKLTLGENTTKANVFDSFPMRGMKLETNQEMYPDSQRGFAPVVSGIARTHAQVTVSQNGNMIYQTYVSPGAFKLSNLNQAGTAGDLVVTVKESDGSTHTQNIAYTSLPVMQHAGHLEYSLAAGQYYQNGNHYGKTPLFASGTAIYGLPHDLTVYGGLLMAENYLSGVAGSGVSLGALGALATDITVARATLTDRQGGNDETSSGTSFRVKYSKSMTTIGTTLNLAAYRYNSEGYYSFNDVNNRYADDETAFVWLKRRRNSWQGTLSQSFDSWGRVHLTAQRDDYWGNSETTDRLTVGYNNSWRGVTYGVNYSQDYTHNNSERLSGVQKNKQKNNMVSLNVSVPMRLFMGGRDAMAQNNMYLTMNSSLDNRGQNRNAVGLSGSALDSALSYNVGESWGNQGQVASTSLGVTYQGSKAQLQAGYNMDKNQQNLNYGLSGGVLIHPYGVTLSRAMYDSMALIRAPGATGVKVMNGTNLRTDGRGYAVVPSLSNYRQNTMMLDPSDMPDNAEVTEAGKRVYPTRGAVVLADYNVQLGQQILMTLRHAGKPVPFGAMATLQGTERGHDVTGIVDDGSRVYLAGMTEHGTLKVSWGQGAEQSCWVNFTLPAQAPQNTTGKGQAQPLRAVQEDCL